RAVGAYGGNALRAFWTAVSNNRGQNECRERLSRSRISARRGRRVVDARGAHGRPAFVHPEEKTDASECRANAGHHPIASIRSGSGKMREVQSRDVDFAGHEGGHACSNEVRRIIRTVLRNSRL